MSALFKYERLMKNHRFRSQVESRAARRFPRGSPECNRLVGALGDVIVTHASEKRRNGELKQQHEFVVGATALTYLPHETAEFYIACIKHDLSEDYEHVWPIQRIRDEDGDDTADLVQAVTAPERLPGETNESYQRRKFNKVASGGPRAKRIKIMDRCHNLATLPRSGSLEKQEGYIAEAEKYILPWVKELKFMEDEFEALLRKHKQRISRQLNRKKRRRKRS